MDQVNQLGVRDETDPEKLKQLLQHKKRTSEKQNINQGYKSEGSVASPSEDDDTDDVFEPTKRLTQVLGTNVYNPFAFDDDGNVRKDTTDAGFEMEEEAPPELAMKNKESIDILVASAQSKSLKHKFSKFGKKIANLFKALGRALRISGRSN